MLMLHRLRWEIRFLLLLLLTPALVWVYLDVRLSWEIDRELRHIRAEGYPVTPDEIKLKSVPCEQNAATVYLQVMAEGGAFSEPRDPRRPFKCPSGNAYGLSYQRVLQGDSEAVARARVILRDPVISGRLEAIAQASRRPECVFPIDSMRCEWTEPSDISFLSAAAWAHMARGALSEREGRLHHALDDYVTTLRLARHATMQPCPEGQEAGRIGYSIVFRRLRPLLAERHLPADDAQALRAFLEAADPEGDCRAALPAVRAHCWGLLRATRRQTLLDFVGGPPCPVCSPSTAPYVLTVLQDGQDELTNRFYHSPLAHPVHIEDMLTWLRLMRGMIEASRLPPRLAYRAVRDAQRAAEAPGWVRRPATFILGSVGSRAHSGMISATASTRLCLIALELKEYWAQHGAYPDTLGELEQALGRPLPEDPHTGRPFGYRRLDEGCLVYHGDLPPSPGVVREPVRLLPGTNVPAESAWACDYDGPLVAPDGPDV